MSAKRLKKALILGIDGCCPDALQAASTPNLNGLIATGAYSGTAQTGKFTISAPGWSDMLTGVWQDKHGVYDNSFEGERYDAYPHFFARLKEKRSDLVTASIVHWEPINDRILRAADFALACQTDDEVAERTADYLLRSNADVVYIQLDDVDAAGHQHGYAANSSGYLDAIAKADAQIGRILAALQERIRNAEAQETTEEWLILAGTDHGGSGHGHGEDIPEHRTIFLLVSGDGAAQGALTPEPVIVDVPPTVAKHLGIEVDSAWGWEGNPIGLLENTPPQPSPS